MIETFMIRRKPVYRSLFNIFIYFVGCFLKLVLGDPHHILGEYIVFLLVFS